MRVPDWMEPLLRQWGAQKRRILTGTRVFPDGHVHEDGWPSISVTASMNEGGSTGGGGARQNYSEVYVGKKIIELWRAMHGMQAEAYEILVVHYAIVGSAPEKAEKLGISRAEYWTRLTSAACYLAGRVEGQKLSGSAK